MKTRQVFPRSMVAHLWANRSQESAREPSKNFWFQNAALYSYGSHYVVGFHMPDAYRIEGARVVLLNAYRHSNTTAKHQSEARRAIRGHDVRVLDVPMLDSERIARIHDKGAALIIKDLENSARASLRDASAPRIRQETISAHVSKAARFLTDARTLAAIDAKRKDLTKEDRKKSAQALRAWPEALPVDRAGVAALNQKLNKAEHVAKAQTWIVEADRRAGSYGYNFDTCRNVDAAERYADATRAAYACAADEFKRAGLDAKARAALKQAQVWKTKADECGAVLLAEKQASAARVVALTVSELGEGVAFASAYAGAVLHAQSGKRAIRLEWWHRNKDEQGAQALSDDLVIHARDVLLSCKVEDETREAFESALVSAEIELSTRELSQVLQSVREVLARQSEALSEGAHTARAVSFAVNNARQRLQNALDSRVCEDLQTQAAQVLAEIKKVQARAGEMIENEERAKREAWRTCDVSYFRFTLADGSAALRLSRDGANIETSQGAFVPVSVAPFVWRASLQCRANNAAHVFADDAPRLGHFTMSRIECDGSIVVGCHVIGFDELQRMADALGFENN